MTAPAADPTTCERCGEAVPDLPFCVRCGNHLVGAGSGGIRRHHFAAAPAERTASVHLVSTLFPHLPRADMDGFRIALLGGAFITAVLVVLGLYPVALVAAAILVPLVYLVYLYDVDVYEDEPIRIVAATMAWGAAAGIATGIVLRLTAPTLTPDARDDPANLLVFGVVIPLVELALILVGPLALLRYRRFNDVLDGVTFGAASALAFGAALVLVESVDVLGAGLTPSGDAFPWLVQVLTIGIIAPTLLASVAAGICAAAWLQYRVPLSGRGELGRVGHPAVAAVVGGVLVVVAALARIVAGPISSLLVMAVLAAIALLWLRRAIHVGLLEEAQEIEIGPPIVCSNCGRATPRHTFCGQCGIALRALPKGRSRQADLPEPPTSDPVAGETGP